MMNSYPARSPDSSVVLEDAPCPLGCAAGDDAVLTAHDRISNLPGEFEVVRCRKCGLMRTSPRPTPETIGFHYPDDYGPYLGTRLQERKGRFSGVARAVVALGRRLFDVKANAIPPLKPGRMLEFGCASGSYLHEMAERGWAVEGIEFSPKAAAAARALGLNVETGAIETIEKPAASFDLVVGWMVLEHLHEPVESLKKIARWTKPGGMLAISVPDAGAAEFRIFGERWYALHIPNHLFHFERRTLETMLARSGWRIVRVQHHRTIANAVASLGYWAEDRGYRRIGRKLADFPERAGRAGALAVYPLSWLFAKLGQTGRMTVWAERISA